MEELKILVDMVAHLPQMALWVVLAFFVYKMSVLASIYGTTRYVVSKIHDWLVTEKSTKVAVKNDIHGTTIDACYPQLMAQLQRIKRATGIYIHSSDVEWLSEAISMKEQSEMKKAKEAN